MINSCKTLIIRFLVAALLPVLLAHTLSASPFDPRFLITVDELCDDGDLALSIPLMRVRLDDSTAIALRAEHVLKTGEYGFAQSEIVLRPLATTLAPYDRDSLVWRKPNGDKAILRKSANKPLADLPGEARKFLDSFKNYQAYESTNGSNVTAWLADDSPAQGLVWSEGIAFCYDDGVLAWFILPSGNKVLVKSDGAMIREMRMGDEPLFSFEQITGTEARISAGTQHLVIRYDGSRIVEITRLPATKLASFNYGSDGLFAAATFGARQRHYAWAETKRPLPANILFVHSRHLQSVDDKRFNYIVTDDSITMSVYISDTLQKSTSLRIHYGTIVSIRETKPK